MNVLLAQAQTTELTWVKIVVGVAVILLGNTALGWGRTAIKRSRLKKALLVDCLETLHKLSQEEFEHNRPEEKTDAKDWECINGHPATYIVFRPLEEAKELISLVNPRDAIRIVRFYERWEMFVRFSDLYSKVHGQLVVALGACCTREDEAKELRHIKEEYFEQLSGACKDMRTGAQELCGISCSIFRTYARSGFWKFSYRRDAKLHTLSEERWINWIAFEIEADRYPTFK